MDMVTKIDPAHGSYHAESPAAFKDAGNAALKTDVVRATHLYTLGIDMAVEGADMAGLDQAELYRLDEASGGALHALLSNRSFAHLEQGDSAAAVDDAALCCLARPDFAKGHMRLLAALQANGASNAERRSACAWAARADVVCAQAGASQLEREKTGNAREEASAQATMSDAEAAAGIALTRRVADDRATPAPWPPAISDRLALGAHGCRRCRRGGAPWRAAATRRRRNLGLLLRSSTRRAGGGDTARRRGWEDKGGARPRPAQRRGRAWPRLAQARHAREPRRPARQGDARAAAAGDPRLLTGCRRWARGGGGGVGVGVGVSCLF